ncbi:hypothetical protein N7488_010470 [Penicillium malachiteum]|nr:hypothetical protein N7488_010470 [Penicillium malachiteum]
MFFSLQIVWYPIEVVLNLLLRIFGRRKQPEKDTEMVTLSTRAESDSEYPPTWSFQIFVRLPPHTQINSTATTAKQDPSHINTIEVQEDCYSESTEADLSRYKSQVDRKVNVMPQL